MVETVTRMIEEFVASEPELQDCFVVEINQTNTKLDVYVDSDSGMTFTKCRRISRMIEEWLDAEEALGLKYTLNVSSPGVDRPLKFHRQYVKNIGRTLEVTPTEGDKVKGELKEVSEAGITLEYKVRRKEGKRKVTVVETSEFAFDNIKKAIVKISF